MRSCLFQKYSHSDWRLKRPPNLRELISIIYIFWIDIHLLTINKNCLLDKHMTSKHWSSYCIKVSMNHYLKPAWHIPASQSQQFAASKQQSPSIILNNTLSVLPVKQIPIIDSCKNMDPTWHPSALLYFGTRYCMYAMEFYFFQNNRRFLFWKIVFYFFIGRKNVFFAEYITVANQIWCMNYSKI